MSYSVLLTNIDSGSWSVSYKIGSTTRTLSVPDGQTREIVADQLSVSGDWQELSSAQVLTSQGDLAERFPPDQTGIFTVLVGLVAGLSFWKTCKFDE